MKKNIEVSEIYSIGDEYGSYVIYYNDKQLRIKELEKDGSFVWSGKLKHISGTQFKVIEASPETDYNGWIFEFRKKDNGIYNLVHADPLDMEFEGSLDNSITINLDSALVEKKSDSLHLNHKRNVDENAPSFKTSINILYRITGAGSIPLTQPEKNDIIAAIEGGYANGFINITEDMISVEFPENTNSDSVDVNITICIPGHIESNEALIDDIKSQNSTGAVFNNIQEYTSFNASIDLDNYPTFEVTDDTADDVEIDVATAGPMTFRLLNQSVLLKNGDRILNETNVSRLDENNSRASSVSENKDNMIYSNYKGNGEDMHGCPSPYTLEMITNYPICGSEGSEISKGSILKMSQHIDLKRGSPEVYANSKGIIYAHSGIFFEDIPIYIDIRYELKSNEAEIALVIWWNEGYAESIAQPLLFLQAIIPVAFKELTPLQMGVVGNEYRFTAKTSNNFFMYNLLDSGIGFSFENADEKKSIKLILESDDSSKSTSIEIAETPDGSKIIYTREEEDGIDENNDPDIKAYTISDSSIVYNSNTTGNGAQDKLADVFKNGVEIEYESIGNVHELAFQASGDREYPMFVVDGDLPKNYKMDDNDESVAQERLNRIPFGSAGYIDICKLNDDDGDDNGDGNGDDDGNGNGDDDGNGNGDDDGNGNGEDGDDDSCKKLEAENKKMQEYILLLISEIEASKKENLGLQDNLGKTQVELAQCEDEKLVLEGELKTTQGELAQCEDDKSKLEDELNVCEQTKKKLQDNLGKTQVELAQCEDDKLVLEGELKTTQGELAQCEDDKSKLEADLKKCVVDLKTVRGELAQCEDDKSKLEGQLKTVRGELLQLGEAIKKLDTQLKTTQSELTQCLDDKSKLEDLLTKCEDEKQMIQDELVLCEQTKKKLEYNLAKTQSELAQCEDDKSKLEDELTKCQNEKQIIQDELNACEQTKKKLQDNLGKTQGELAQCEDVKSILEADLKKCVVDLKTAEGELAQCEDDKSKLEDELTKCQNEKQMIQDELTKCEDEKQIIQDKLDACENGNNKKCMSELKETQEALALCLDDKSKLENELNDIKILYGKSLDRIINFEKLFYCDCDTITYSYTYKCPHCCQYL